MNRKVFMFLILGSFLQLFQSQQTQAFDPESTTFSQERTLKTWVASSYQNTEDFKQIQEFVALQVPQNPFSVRFRLPVENNTGDERYFGKNFATLAAIELPFLHFVKRVSSENTVLTLEIGGAIGLVSWKVPYAFGTKSAHYVNDLSEVMLNGKFQQVIDSRLKSRRLRNAIHKLPGDCLTILDQHPELEGKFSAIYVQNVEHFFNPAQHREFFGIIGRLLKQDGRVFLSAHSFKFFMDNEANDLRKLYIRKKVEREVYSGFVSYQFSFVQNLQGGIRPDKSGVSKVEYPSEKAATTTATLKKSTGNDGFQHVTQYIVENCFSPDIYRDAVSLHPSLEVVDTFFVTEMGERNDSPNWKDGFSPAAVIIRKK